MSQAAVRDTLPLILDMGYNHVFPNMPEPGMITATRNRWVTVIVCSQDWREAMRRSRRMLDYANYICISVPRVAARDAQFATKRMGYGLFCFGDTKPRISPRMSEKDPPHIAELKRQIARKTPLTKEDEGAEPLRGEQNGG